MLLNKIVLSKTPPTSPNTVWAKPSNGGVSLYTYSDNKWGPILLMDDMGTDNPDDDLPGKVITLELFDETIQDLKDYVSENYVSNIKVLITTPPATLNAQVGYYYCMGGSGVVVDTMTIQLPAIADKNKTKNVQFFMTMGSAPEVTFVSAGTERILYQKDFALEAERSYEVNALWNGHAWVITVVEIIVPFFAKLFLNNGEVVKLQGSGELTKAMVTPYKSSVVSAEIGELCTSIGNSVFGGCSGLRSVTIPDSVTNIGDNAFYNCTGLTSITIPNSVTRIDNYAFSYCSGLTNVTIGSGVTSIGSSAFNQCTGLTSITIPNSVTSIGQSAFSYCSGLTNVTIGSGVTSIGNYAFQDCRSLTSITSFAATAPTIKSSTFKDVKTGGTLTVPVGSTGYDTWMGTGNYYLGSLGWTNKVIPFFAKLSLNNGEVVELQGSGELTQATVRQITQYGTSIVSAEIGKLCTSIGDGAFSYCQGLTSVTIPDSVTNIGDSAFQGCTSLTSITIPNSVSGIGDSAFLKCTSLTSITIPDSVTSIGNSAFNSCYDLTKITSLATTAPTIGDNTFSYVKTGGTLYVPSDNTGYDVWMGTGNYYLGKYSWTMMPMNIITYEASAKLVETTSPHSDGLHTNAFSGKNGQLTMTSHTFENGIGTIEFDGDVTSLGERAFYNCESLTSITIPDSVTSIGEYAFSSCSVLTSITIGSGVTSIGNSAFFDCSGLTTITCNAITAPTIQSGTFSYIKTGGTLSVPSGSTGYDVWMGTGDYYLGKYNWTKVEQ